MLEALTDTWAKLKKEDGKIVARHPLLAQSAHAAAVVMHLISRTVLRRRFACAARWSDLKKAHWQRLMYLAAQHDIGKSCSGFQQRATQPVGSDHLTPLAARQFHEITADLLDLKAISAWTSNGAFDRIIATLCHHGGSVSMHSSTPARVGSKGQTEAKQLSATIRSWTSHPNKNVKPFPDVPLLQHMFDGALTLALDRF